MNIAIIDVCDVADLCIFGNDAKNIESAIETYNTHELPSSILGIFGVVSKIFVEDGHVKVVVNFDMSQHSCKLLKKDYEDDKLYVTISPGYEVGRRKSIHSGFYLKSIAIRTENRFLKDEQTIEQ